MLLLECTAALTLEYLVLRIIQDTSYDVGFRLELKKTQSCFAYKIPKAALLLTLNWFIIRDKLWNNIYWEMLKIGSGVQYKYNALKT